MHYIPGACNIKETWDCNMYNEPRGFMPQESTLHSAEDSAVLVVVNLFLQYEGCVIKTNLPLPLPQNEVTGTIVRKPFQLVDACGREKR